MLIFFVCFVVGDKEILINGVRKVIVKYMSVSK